MPRKKGDPEWNGKKNVFEAGTEFVKFRATDFGMLGVRVDFESPEGNVSSVLPPDKVEAFTEWISVVCGNEVMALPANAENVLSALLEKNKAAKFMSKRERLALAECVHNLKQVELLRKGEAETDLFTRSRKRNHVGIKQSKDEKD